MNSDPLLDDLTNLRTEIRRKGFTLDNPYRSQFLALLREVDELLDAYAEREQMPHPLYNLPRGKSDIDEEVAEVKGGETHATLPLSGKWK